MENGIAGKYFAISVPEFGESICTDENNSDKNVLQISFGNYCSTGTAPGKFLLSK